MGLVFGRLWKKKSSEEVLEGLDKEIKSIEEYRRSTELAQRRTVGRFVIISVGIYVATALILYFYFFPSATKDRLIYSVPLVFALFVIFALKRLLSWYYRWKISRKQSKLTTLKEQKKKLLEQVMETETYKVAKSLLDRFSEPPVRRNTMPSSTELTPKKPLVAVTPQLNAALRQRAVPSSQVQSSPNKSLATKSEFRTPALPHGRTSIVGTPKPLPGPVLPRERSFLDKMVDYLVGDGPANRYALICKNCSSHNGMAVREEFEYTSFRCCYCFAFNPARKQRPAAPRLDLNMSRRRQSDSSESDGKSSTESESEPEQMVKKTLITEVTKIEEIEEKTATPVSGEPMEVDISKEATPSTVENAAEDKLEEKKISKKAEERHGNPFEESD